MSKAKEITCEEALKRVFDFLDKTLEHDHHDEMEDHIHRCKSCFSRVEFEKKLKDRIGETGEETVPDSLHSKINNILRKY
ncbi:MAG: zf-HC2 domain-containing protein [Gammaproteobacteria bacterium]|nr:zf-HC2 domain-containing protein [Gammaproteobacteria bacterium]